MNDSQIDRYLGYLDTALQKLGIQANLLVVGGPIFVAILQSRPSTQDIDIVIVANDARTYTNVKKAINLVAQDHHLPDNWMNDDVTLIIDQIGKPKTPRIPDRWGKYTHLHVYIPELEYLLALKLFAGRPQDDRDIRVLALHLGVQTKAQARTILSSYIPQMQLQMRPDYIQAIDRCFKK